MVYNWAHVSYTDCIKMVQVEKNIHDNYDLCPKCMSSWYHVKAEWMLFLLRLNYIICFCKSKSYATLCATRQNPVCATFYIHRSLRRNCHEGFNKSGTNGILPNRTKRGITLDLQKQMIWFKKQHKEQLFCFHMVPNTHTFWTNFISRKIIFCFYHLADLKTQRFSWVKKEKKKGEMAGGQSLIITETGLWVYRGQKPIRCMVT